jgi:hypothetical protein
MGLGTTTAVVLVPGPIRIMAYDTNGAVPLFGLLDGQRFCWAVSGLPWRAFHDVDRPSDRRLAATRLPQMMHADIGTMAHIDR